MSFYVYFLSGVAGGLLGGMGMGGGTLLIPLLTLAFGVRQGAAQGANLLAFLPMSALALHIHAKEGRLEKKGLGSLVIPALLFSGAFAFFAAALPSHILRKGFGLFLLLLSAFPFSSSLPFGGRRRKKFGKFSKRV